MRMKTVSLTSKHTGGVMRFSKKEWSCLWACLFACLVFCTCAHTDESPLLKETIHKILTAPPSPERQLKGPKKPGKVALDEFHPDRAKKTTPAHGGQIIQRISVEPRVLHSWLDNSAVTSTILGYVQESLLGMDSETWEDIPALAERWIVEDVVELLDGGLVRGGVEKNDREVVIKLANGTRKTFDADDVGDVRLSTSFTFYLRKGVVFHNGMPFSAEDVAFSFQVLKNPYSGIPHLANYYEDLESCEILDNYTVRLTYGRQYWRALNFAGGFGIMCKKLWDPDGLLDKDPKAFGAVFQENLDLLKKPVGTGPYCFKEWKKGVEIVLKRNPEYYNSEKSPAWLNTIRFRIITDETAALQSLKSEQVDFLPGVEPEKWLNMQKDEAYQGKFCYVETLYPAYGYIGWNLRRPMFSDVRVRWALALGAFDMDRFIDEVLQGRAMRVTHNQFVYGRAGHKGLQPVPFMPDTARELLKDAGWWDHNGNGIIDKDGLEFSFTLFMPQSSQTAPQVRMATQIQENLSRLGIKMEQQMLEWGLLLEQLNNHDFDAVRIGWAFGSPPDEGDAYQIWHSSQAVKQGSNHVGFVHEQMDRLIETSRQTLDLEKRLSLQNQISEIIYREQPYLFLYTSQTFSIYRAGYRNVKFYLPRPGFDLSEWYAK